MTGGARGILGLGGGKGSRPKGGSAAEPPTPTATAANGATPPNGATRPAVLSCSAGTFTLHATDLSERGVGLRGDRPAGAGAPAQGERCTVRVGGEPAERDARIAWVETDGSHGVRLGVEFVRQPTLDLDEVKIDPQWALRIPARLATRRQVLPFASLDGVVHVACVSLSDNAALAAVQKAVKMPVKAELVDAASLRRALDRVYGDPAAMAAAGVERRVSSIDLETGQAEMEADDAVGLCNELMHASILRHASDVHIDPDAEGVQIRFRVDGELEKYRRLPARTHAGVLSRFKVLAGMDIAEKRAPQDGRFTHQFGPTSQRVDIRVATIPTKYGERMTLRLLALQTDSLTLEKLGMLEDDHHRFCEALDRPHGMILITGPTGSGKSTTLYGGIRRLISREELNVITIEDPVEYEIGGVAQVEVDSADKVSFNKALRSVLRHDPDVVMIGEIRDGETADIAIKGALTGHLVLSTLHTNTAGSAVTRLLDMGVEPFLTAATLRLVVAQRLVRSLCRYCSVERGLTATEAAALRLCEEKDAGRPVHDAGGCVYCANRGYAGRIGLFEMIAFDEELSRLVAEGVGESGLVEASRRKGSRSLLADAAEKLLSGRTSPGEVLRAVTAW